MSTVSSAERATSQSTIPTLPTTVSSRAQVHCAPSSTNGPRLNAAPATKLAVRSRPWWAKSAASRSQEESTTLERNDVTTATRSAHRSSDDLPPGAKRREKMAQVMASLIDEETGSTNDPRASVPERVRPQPSTTHMQPNQALDALLVERVPQCVGIKRGRLPSSIRDVVEKVDQISECITRASADAEKFGRSSLSRVLRKAQVANQNQVHELVNMLMKERSLRKKQQTQHAQILAMHQNKWASESQVLRDALSRAERMILAKEARLRVQQIQIPIVEDRHAAAARVADGECQACKDRVSRKRRRKSQRRRRSRKEKKDKRQGKTAS